MTKERNVMLGFSASNGVEIKGRYARKMRAEALRRESGNLNKHDKQVIQFLQESLHSSRTIWSGERYIEYVSAIEIRVSIFTKSGNPLNGLPLFCAWRWTNVKAQKVQKVQSKNKSNSPAEDWKDGKMIFDRLCTYRNERKMKDFCYFSCICQKIVVPLQRQR